MFFLDSLLLVEIRHSKARAAAVMAGFYNLTNTAIRTHKKIHACVYLHTFIALHYVTLHCIYIYIYIYTQVTRKHSTYGFRTDMLFPCGDSSLLSPRLTVEACSKRCQRHPRKSLATAVLLYVIRIQYIVIHIILVCY